MAPTNDQPMNTEPQPNQPDAAAPATQQQVITARMVGWALSGATIASLLVGLIVVEYFGRVSDRPQREENPEPLVSESPQPQERPTVLRSMGRDDAAEGDVPGFNLIFSPDSPSAPRVDTAVNATPGWR